MKLRAGIPYIRASCFDGGLIGQGNENDHSRGSPGAHAVCICQHVKGRPSAPRAGRPALEKMGRLTTSKPCAWRLSSGFRGWPAKGVFLPGTGTPTFDAARNPVPGYFIRICGSFLRCVSAPALMERDMRNSRSRRICLSCSRILPRAAARCPWCIASIVVPAGPFDNPNSKNQPEGRSGGRRIPL